MTGGGKRSETFSAQASAFKPAGGPYDVTLAAAHGFPADTAWLPEDRLLAHRAVWTSRMTTTQDAFARAVADIASGIGEPLFGEEAPWTERWARTDAGARRWQRKVGPDGSTPLHILQWSSKQSHCDSRIALSLVDDTVHVAYETREDPLRVLMGASEEFAGLLNMFPGLYSGGAVAHLAGCFVSDDDVPEVAEQLSSPERTIPIALITLDNPHGGDTLTKNLIAAHVGFAAPYFLTREARERLIAELPGWDDEPYRVRLYLPGQELGSLLTSNVHPVPSGKHDVLLWAARHLMPQLVRACELQRVPDVLRPGTPLPAAAPAEPAGQPPTVDPAALREELATATARVADLERALAQSVASSETRAAEMQLELDQAREELEAMRLEVRDLRARDRDRQRDVDLVVEQWHEDQRDLEQELATSQRLAEQIRYLQAELARSGVHVDPDDAPRDVRPTTFKQVLTLLSELDLVKFTGDPLVAEELDQHSATLGGVPSKTWEVLQALNDYALQKAEGLDRNLAEYLRFPPPGARVFSANLYVPGESATVRQKHASERVFPVPEGIDVRERVEMTAHVRLGSRGLISPRLYLYDATRIDGRVYVGYIGRHLTNTRSS